MMWTCVCGSSVFGHLCTGIFEARQAQRRELKELEESGLDALQVLAVARFRF